MKKSILLAIMAIILSSGAIMAVEAVKVANNLLQNGVLRVSPSMGRPKYWKKVKSTVVKNNKDDLPENAKFNMTISIDKKAKYYGYINQKIKLSNSQGKYKISAVIKSSVPGLAFVQVKLLKGRKSIKRINTSLSKLDWAKVSKTFSAQGADSIEVLLRWKQSEEAVGENVSFALVELVEIK